jgi:hypothetical protein
LELVEFLDQIRAMEPRESLAEPPSERLITHGDGGTVSNLETRWNELDEHDRFGMIEDGGRVQGLTVPPGLVEQAREQEPLWRQGSPKAPRDVGGHGVRQRAEPIDGSGRVVTR